MNSYIKFPSTIQSFNNTESTIKTALSGRSVFVLKGEIMKPGSEYCLSCHSPMHAHSRQERSLCHIPFGGGLSRVEFTQTRYFCPKCHATRNQLIPFKAQNQKVFGKLKFPNTSITTELEAYTEELLAYHFTNEAVLLTEKLVQPLTKLLLSSVGGMSHFLERA